ncbi:Neurochondrin [Nymphaea thermarum]|nr:Neurochondrin [Nymphaea thermarum]
MDDCLKLLKGEKDEQKFAGLLLATRLCQGNDDASVRKIYDAVGFRFLNRLLRTGLGKGGDSEERKDYLKLAVTVLATFCRLPEVASSADMLSTVPLFLEILRKRSSEKVGVVIVGPCSSTHQPSFPLETTLNLLVNPRATSS